MRRFIVFSLALAAGYVLAQSEEPDYIALGEPDNYPEESGEVLTAAVRWVEELGYEAVEFHAAIHECEAEWCEISVYPRELDLEDTYRSYRGCPLKACVTMRYIFQSRSFESVVGWR
jgi:hypothetical protein